MKRGESCDGKESDSSSRADAVENGRIRKKLKISLGRRGLILPHPEELRRSE